jgi:hypothetical protein
MTDSLTQKIIMPNKIIKDAGAARNAKGDKSTRDRMYDHWCDSVSRYSGLSMKIITAPQKTTTHAEYRNNLEAFLDRRH